MAENGFWAAEEHGSHPPTPLAQQTVPNHIDTAVHDVESALSDPPLDLSIAQAEFDQLPASDHAMLCLGEPRNALVVPRTVERAPFRLHRRRKGARFRLGLLALHEADIGMARRTYGAPSVTFWQRKEVPARRYRLWL
ncbi:MAG TPA: hypothetical protein VFJ64_10055 [Solirubrobacterales bacterium]|nr:hypothetical protein [Solirubrobacterales bacterium]